MQLETDEFLTTKSFKKHSMLRTILFSNPSTLTLTLAAAAAVYVSLPSPPTFNASFSSSFHTTSVDSSSPILQMNRNHRKPKRGNKTKRAVSNYSRKQKALTTKKPKYSPAPYRPLESKPELR
jgi:hypothetical protein